PVPIACHQRRDRRQIASRRLAADGEARRVDAELAGALGDPEQRRVAILRRRGIWMLGREPIVDGHDHTAGVEADVRALCVVDGPVDRAADEAAAVEVDEGRVRRLAERRVDTRADLGAVYRNTEVIDVCDLRDDETAFTRASFE